MIEKCPAPDPGKVLVTFRMDRSIWAEWVLLVGDFGQEGRRKTVPMVRTHDDPDWHVTLEVEANRRYRFGYVLDGHVWNVDNQADDFVSDCQGHICAIVDTYPAFGRSGALSIDLHEFDHLA